MLNSLITRIQSIPVSQEICPPRDRYLAFAFKTLRYPWIPSFSKSLFSRGPDVVVLHAKLPNIFMRGCKRYRAV